MLEKNYTHRFIKDLKLSNKRGKDMKKLERLMENLANRKQLEKLYRLHRLIGQYQDRYECHVESDWLLIYKIQGNVIIFERIGTHSDLFK